MFTLLGIASAILWVCIVLYEKRRIKALPVWTRYEIYAVAAYIMEYTVNENTVDVNIKLNVLAVRAESKEKAEQMVRKELGETKEIGIVTTVLPEDWLKEKIHARSTTSTSLSSQ